jgi:hypothetical protein
MRGRKGSWASGRASVLNSLLLRATYLLPTVVFQSGLLGERMMKMKDLHADIKNA